MKLKGHALVAAGLVSFFLVGLASAQWPTSSASPLVVSDRSGEQAQPKIAAVDGGGFYLSWFDNSTGGYDVTLQRLDVEGLELWPHNGVEVADRTFSMTQDYGLSVDTAGNALLAFRDDRVSPTEITVAKVSPDGSLLWGTGGIQVSTAGVFVASPRVTGTSDGNVVVAWTSDVNVMIQKLDTNGAPLWGSGITFTPPVGHSFAVSDLHASDAGNAIVSFTHTTGLFLSPIHLWTQKLAAADGELLWNVGHVQVFGASGGSLQIANFPPFVSDEMGGAVFAWYSSSPTLQVRAQRILANGTEAFTSQGVEVSTNGTRVRVGGSAAFNPVTEETFVSWTEQTSNQSQSALYAQKFDVSGVRQWTDDGRGLMPMSTDQIFGMSILTIEEGALVTWIHSPTLGNDPIYSIRVDSNGDFSWLPPLAEVCILPTGSSRLVGSMGSEAFAAYAWTDGSSNGDIYAANLNGDGSLGNQVVLFRDGFESDGTTAWSGSTQ